MKWMRGGPWGKISGAAVVGLLGYGLVGCAAGDLAEGVKGAIDVGGRVTGAKFPFPTPAVCLSRETFGFNSMLDLGDEALAFRNEKPTVEAALDRLMTVRSNGEVNHIIMTILPLSEGADWPQKVRDVKTSVGSGKFQDRLQQQPAAYGENVGLTSTLKRKTLDRQNLLFAKYPDWYAVRNPGAVSPSEEAVRTFKARVLGPNSSPIFTRVFHRFLKYHPDYEPKSELFAGRLDGKATETYASLHDAVVALADNKSEIGHLREAVLQAEEKKAKEYRDILDLEGQIKRLESAEFGNPSTTDQAAEASKRDTNAKQVEELKQQLAVQKREFETTVAAYTQEIEKLGIELAKIKAQVTAFTPEQQALGNNIRAVIGAVKGTMCESQLLLAMAIYQFTEAGPQWQSEVESILRQGGPAGSERIKRITLNMATLPTLLSVYKTEAEVLEKEVKAYDGLFESRLAAESSGGAGGSTVDTINKGAEGLGRLGNMLLKQGL